LQWWWPIESDARQSMLHKPKPTFTGTPSCPFLLHHKGHLTHQSCTERKVARARGRREGGQGTTTPCLACTRNDKPDASSPKAVQKAKPAYIGNGRTMLASRSARMTHASSPHRLSQLAAHKEKGARAGRGGRGQAGKSTTTDTQATTGCM
jgi:hypothetical protein